MKILNQFPHRVRDVENIWIPMSDGTRLAARLWLPEDAEHHPVPAILEYIPYRKRDGVRLRDESIHPYFAGHGYACVRVDLRGSGDSEGVLRDEYLTQELEDGVATISWIANQTWCVGSVGMMGISWGGFNALQIAALQPPALQAVISVCSTDDRYADDVHYMGGCLLGDNLSWAATMFSYNSLPPDPEVVGDGWREMWFERLRGSGHWLEGWLTHQHRDDYWRHGSICEDFAKVRVPVMAVSGWADGYSNAAFRLLRGLPGPRLGLIGPWSHKYPHLGVPGPAVGFLQEALRWWDHWLKGLDTGITAEPMLRAWMLDSMAPDTSYHQRFGRWVSERSWPSPDIHEQTLFLGDQRLLPERQSESTILSIRSPLSVGLFAGKWCSYSATPDLPHDQREEDGGALIFTTAPLEEPIEILGAPEVQLTVSADRPIAMVAVRLSDVQPDDKATRVTYGLLNLTHRESHAAPEALTPGEFYQVTIRMNDIAQRFPKGHRLRLSVSTSYFPLAWTPPEPVRVVIDTSESRLTLPVRAHRIESVAFADPEASSSGARRLVLPEHHNWRVLRDLATDTSTLEVIDDHGVYHLEDINMKVGRRAEEWYSYQGDDFSSPSGKTRWVRMLERGGWRIRTETTTQLTCDQEYFHLVAELDAYEGDKRVYSRNWDRRLKRQLL
jgi:putative CocE/NonD family hydrolase